MIRPRTRAVTAVLGAGLLVALPFALPAGAVDEPTAAPTTTPTTTTTVAPVTTTTTATTTTATTATTAPAPLRAAGTPSIGVTPTAGLLPDGGTTITVTGRGFDPVKNNKVGVYVVFGPVDPGTYFEDANRFLAAVWVHPGAAAGPGQAEMAADGSFTVTLPRPGSPALTATYTDGNGTKVDCRVTPCQVFTMAAHGNPDRSQDTFRAVSFAATGGSTTTAAPGATGSGSTTGMPSGSTGSSSTGSSATGSSSMGTATGSSATGSDDTLAATGADSFTPTIVGLLLLAGGLWLLGSQARRELGAATRAESGISASGSP